MYIDLSFINPFVPYWPVVMPFIVTVLAGILRQDGLKPSVNKGITTVLVLAASVFVAFYNHALSGDIPLDFTVILGYCTAIMRIPEMRNLQSYIQTNWLNVIAAEAQKLTAAQPATTVPQFTTQVPQPPVYVVPNLSAPGTATVPNVQYTTIPAQPMTLPTIDRSWTALETPVVSPPQQG